MKANSKIHFSIIADALAFYYKQNNSLFTEQMIREELGQQPEVIRSIIKGWANATPEQLVMHIEPARIKHIISKTVLAIKNKKSKCPDIRINTMTIDETENAGQHLSVNYRFADTRFGPVIIASTAKGICYLAFSDEGNKEAFNKLKKRLPNATYNEIEDKYQFNALSLFENKAGNGHPVQLHLKGTPFQINIWKKLVKIPWGGLMSYSSLTDDPKNSHALGAAVGSNPVAYIIPCHRTVRASGEFGEYHWGTNRKAALICLEAVQYNS